MEQGIEITLVGMNEIAQEGLKRILASENFDVKSMGSADVEASACDGSSASDRLRIFVIDSSLGHLDGEVLAICEKVHRCYPDARVAVLADGFEYEEVVRAFDWGVDGYILKSISCEPLFGLLRLIALGEKALPSQLADSLHRHLPMPINGDWDTSVRAMTLSGREAEVLICLSRGMANKVISRQHNITEATVKVHVKAILRKLHVANRTQAAIWAVQHGLDADLIMSGDPAELGAEEGEEDAGAASIFLLPSAAPEVFAPQLRARALNDSDQTRAHAAPASHRIAS